VPKPHLLTGRSICILFGYGVLSRDGTLHSIHGAGEVGDETIASRVKDPTVMRGDQVIDDDPVSGEGPKRADLIEPHQAAVALDVRRENCRELSLDVVGFQPRHLPDRV
jgi:hypothetical protein